MTRRKKKGKQVEAQVSEASFTAKVSAFPRWAGRSVLERAFLLSRGSFCPANGALAYHERKAYEISQTAQRYFNDYEISSCRRKGASLLS